jgi:cell division transport system ATP-binding protein
MTQSPPRSSVSSRYGAAIADPQAAAAASPASRETRSHQDFGGQTIVTLSRVSKVFTSHNVPLKDINLHVRRGEFVFITGASGAGKSTLLRMLYGAEQASAGQVAVGGVSLRDIRPRQLAMLRRRVGVVFQDYKLLPNRTVGENVAFVLRAQGLSRREIQRRLSPALKMVGLLDKQDRFPNELSGGEQQRASLARAIVNTPPLLVADEPTGNLDPENSLIVLQILERLNSFGVTIVMTTHNHGLVSRTSHRCLQLEAGRLLEVL